MSMMTFERFDELASTYGATIDLWPSAEQAAARSLADTSAEAKDALARERALDEAMNVWQAPGPSEAPMARVLSDAAEVSAAAPVVVTESAPQTKPETRGFFARIFGDMGWRPTGALAACLAIAVVATQTGQDGSNVAPAPLTEAELAQQAEDAEILTAFFDDSLFDDEDLFDTDAEFL